MLAYLKLWLDWGDKTKALKDDEKGRLIDAMVAYASGNDPEPFLTGNEVYVFPVFECAIKREQEEYKKNSVTWAENGKKGGRPKKTESNQEETKKTNRNQKNQIGFSETKKTQDKEKDKDKDKDKELNLSELEKAILRFRQHRKSIKAPLSDMGEKMLMTELQKLAGDDEELKIKIIDRSIMNGWKGVFPYKEDATQKKQKQSTNYEQHDYKKEDMDKLFINLDEEGEKPC